MVQKSGTQQLRQAPGYGRARPVGGGQIENGSAVVCESEAHVAARQGSPAHQLLQVGEFGLVRTQELAPGRRVVEEVAYLQSRSDRVGRRHRLPGPVAAVAADAPCPIGVPVPGDEHEPGDGRYARQGLAAKTQGGDGLQVLQVGDLTGGMTRERQGQVLPRDPRAVVADPQQLDAALLGVDLDAVGTGIEAVLDELLGHRRGPFHHLSGGDLIDELGRKLPDPGGHARMEAKSRRRRKRASRASPRSIPCKNRLLGLYTLYV